MTADQQRIHSLNMARFGMVLVIVVEAMMFAGLISAFSSIRAALDWPPLDQPRYPAATTALNTLVLLASGGTMLLFRRLQSRPAVSRQLLNASLFGTLLLGLLFLILQGTEWVRLVNYGLTVASGSYGSIFYLIISFHGIHVLSGLIVLALTSVGAVARGFPVKTPGLEAAGIFWYFVVLVWPLLYVVVYF